MVTILYFAAARERSGTDREALDVGGRAVRDVLDEIVRRHPHLAPIRARLRVAVDQAFAGADDVVPDGAEIALIPPVAGGAGLPSVQARVVVREAPLSIDEAIAQVAHRAAGAEVVMIGTVRDHNEGDEVERLEYEAYVPMAEQVIAGIVREVEEAFPGTVAAVQHRIGPLAIGDRAVIVAVSAPHRGDAFAACQRIIDRLKEDAPIWKHEHRKGGVVWVGLGP